MSLISRFAVSHGSMPKCADFGHVLCVEGRPQQLRGALSIAVQLDFGQRPIGEVARGDRDTRTMGFLIEKGHLFFEAASHLGNAGGMIRDGRGGSGKEEDERQHSLPA